MVKYFVSIGLSHTRLFFKLSCSFMLPSSCKHLVYRHLIATFGLLLIYYNVMLFVVLLRRSIYAGLFVVLL